MSTLSIQRSKHAMHLMLCLSTLLTLVFVDKDLSRTFQILDEKPSGYRIQSESGLQRKGWSSYGTQEVRLSMIVNLPI